MNNKKYFLAFVATALLTITACNNPSKSNGDKSTPAVDSFYEKLKGLDNETDVDIIEELTLVNQDAIYGNVYLPTEVGGGAHVAWWSSNEDIIYPKYDGDIAPGEVTRPNKDTEVTLIAEIQIPGKSTKFEQTVTVKAAPEEIEDEDAGLAAAVEGMESVVTNSETIIDEPAKVEDKAE